MGVRFNGMGPRRTAILRRERLLFFGGSTLMFSLLVIGALLVYSNTNIQAKSPVVERATDTEIAFGTVTLIAPAGRVQKGTKLSASTLQKVHWPRDRVPEGAIRSLEDANGMFAVEILPANQPVLRSSIAAKPPSFGLGELLPPGHRAVTIEVNAVSGIEGWATAGAHVDVFLTYLDPKEGVHKTRLAVEDAVVLSYGGKAEPVESGSLERAQVKSTVTLAVPFDDSLKIHTATAVGRITLALRNPHDLGSQGKEEFSANDWNSRARMNNPSDRTFIPNGHAVITDSTGIQKEFVLGKDNRWWVSSEDDN